MKTLEAVVEIAVANAFRAGAEWHAIVVQGQDSATVGRDSGAWRKHHRYQDSVKRQQVAAVEAVARSIVRMALTAEQEKQVRLFTEEDAS